MIDLAYDTSTDSVRLVRAVTIKAGSPGVPVRLTFSSAPTKTVSDIQIALGTEGASPSVLAFNEDFTAESSTVWTATLDANDTRLVNYMNGRKQADTNAELVLFLDGERQAYQNITVTVQPPVINGPETTEGGPVYLTDIQTRSAIAAEVPAILIRYPLHVPVRCFVNDYANYGSGQGDATLYNDGVMVHGVGVMKSTDGGTATGEALYNIPNGYAPGIPGRAGIVVTPIVAGFLEASNLVTPPQVSINFSGSTPVWVLGNDIAWQAADYALGGLKNTIGADDISVLLPRTSNGKLVCYFHGAGNDYLSHITDSYSATSTQLLIREIVSGLLTEGYTIISSNGGSNANHWGNSASLTAFNAALAWIQSEIEFSEVVILGQSMGATTAIRACTTHSEIEKTYLIYPVCDLQWMHDNSSFTAQINTAYGGNFATNSVGCDPMDLALPGFVGKSFRLTASASDTVVPKANNTDPFITKITGTADSVTLRTHTGNHGDPSAFDASDIISFFAS